MRKTLGIVVLIASLATIVTAAPISNAQENQKPSGTMMDGGMMKMMMQMSEMMESCNKMMQNTHDRGKEPQQAPSDGPNKN